MNLITTCLLFILFGFYENQKISFNCIVTSQIYFFYYEYDLVRK